MKNLTKLEVITTLVEKLNLADVLHNKDQFLTDVIKREEQSTTGIGKGVAIPHAKSAAVKQVSIACAKSDEGVDFASLDGEATHLIFLIAVPEKAAEIHLNIIAKLSTILMNENARTKLLHAKTAKEMIDILDFYDENDVQSHLANNDHEHPFVVAVTGCPTGIAHTYMAAHALESAAAESGIPLKVETNGAAGVKNQLTKDEIEQAIAVIITSDTKVDLARFSGKHLIISSVSDGVSKPKQLIEKAVKRDGPIYDHNNEKQSGGRKRRDLYQHVMNGLSNMLPLAIGAGFLLSLAIYSSDMTHSFWEILSFFGEQTIVSLLMPIFSGYIAKSIADRPGFAPGAIGGLFAAINGAGLLGGICAGLLAGWIVNWLKKLSGKLPTVLTAMSSIIIYPVAGILITILAMYVILIPLVIVNENIISFFNVLNPMLALAVGAILGLLMAIDLGGPINKITYLSGIGFMLNGVYEPMAAIMAGGMVPPLSIAIASTIFRSRFSSYEQKVYRTNYIKGLFFMTEGAIPFVAKHRRKFLPPILVGAGCAGGISMFAGTGLAIPHGGVLVTPFIFGSSIVFLAAVIIGSIVSAIMLGFLKKIQFD